MPREASHVILVPIAAALDTESERHVQTAIDNSLHGRTVVIIAHRMSTVQGATQIAVIVNGLVEDVAPHSVLRTRCKAYQKLLQVKNSDSSDAAVKGASADGPVKLDA